MGQPNILVMKMKETVNLTLVDVVDGVSIVKCLVRGEIYVKWYVLKAHVWVLAGIVNLIEIPDMSNEMCESKFNL